MPFQCNLARFGRPDFYSVGGSSSPRDSKMLYTKSLWVTVSVLWKYLNTELNNIEPCHLCSLLLSQEIDLQILLLILLLCCFIPLFNYYYVPSQWLSIGLTTSNCILTVLPSKYVPNFQYFHF